MIYAALIKKIFLNEILILVKHVERPYCILNCYKNSLAAKLFIMTFFHRSSICSAAGKLIGAGQYSRGKTYCEY